MNIVNQMLSDYKNRSDQVETDSEFAGNPTEKRLQKKIPWNVSSSIVLILGIVALTGFIIYSYPGIPYFESFQQQADDDSAQDVKLLASIQQSPLINEQAKQEGLEIGIDEREQIVPDETVPPGVLTGSMPPLSKEMANDAKGQVAKIIDKPVEKTEIVKKRDEVLAKTPTKAKQIVDPIKKITSEKKNIAIGLKKSRKTVIAKNDTKTLKKLEPKLEIKNDNKARKKSAVEIFPISNASESKAIDKTIVPLTDEQFAQKNYQTAMEYINNGQSAKAASLLEGALQKHPAHLLARKALTGILIEDKAWVRAEQHLKSALIHNPESKLVPMWLARIYLELNRSAEAVKVLESRERYAKGDGDYYALLAMALQNSHLNSKAIDAYKQAIKIDNYKSQWWFGLAMVFEIMEKWTEAYSAYNQAINTAQLPLNMNLYAKERLNYVKMQLELLAEMSE